MADIEARYKFRFRSEKVQKHPRAYNSPDSSPGHPTVWNRPHYVISPLKTCAGKKKGGQHILRKATKIRQKQNVVLAWRGNIRLLNASIRCYTICLSTKRILLPHLHGHTLDRYHHQSYLDIIHSYRAWNGQIMLRKFPQVLSRLLAFSHSFIQCKSKP